MAKYTHEQLCLFAQPASETEETKLERAIEAVKRALGNSDIILSDKYEIFGQGSYANNTNVRNNSDVDINVCYTAAYYYELPRVRLKMIMVSEVMFNILTLNSKMILKGCLLLISEGTML